MFFPSISLIIPNVFIASLAIRSSKYIYRTLHLTLIVSIFGILNTGFLIASYQKYTTDHEIPKKIATLGLFFGLALVPAIWMVGITLFSILFEKPLLVFIGYFLTLAELILIVIAMVSVGEFVQDDKITYLSKDKSLYSNIYKTIISSNWLYFLLFFSLLILYRYSIYRNTMITLITFGLLNTSRLITETILQKSSSELEANVVLYILFFFTDFISIISLYMTTFAWKNVEAKPDIKYSLPHINN